MSNFPDDSSETRALLVDIAALKKSEAVAKGARDYSEAIMESIPPFLVLDAELRVHKVNQSFCEHFHTTSAEAEGILLYQLGGGEWNIPELRSFLEQILPRNVFFRDFEMIHDFRVIGRRTLLLSGRQVDHLERILLFIDDITERVTSRVALRASEIRYRRLFEAAQDGILILNPETRKIEDANPYMTQLLGFSRQQLLGMELWQIGLLEDETANRSAFERLHRDGFIRYDDLPLATQEGGQREVEFVSNLYQEDGAAVIQCNIRDITRRKQAEQKLVAAQNELSHRAERLEETVIERTGELRQTMEEMEAFSYSLSHDMRAPLRAMRGFAQEVLTDNREKLGGEAVHYLERIDAAAGRMDALIRDVLSYTRVARGNLQMKSLDAETLVREIIDMYTELHPGQCDISVEGVLPRVSGSDVSFCQCISNLLTNAVKFVAPGTRPKIRIHSEVEGTRVRIWVEDNGIGIAPKDQQRIFQMFERVHAGEHYEGTGIGLAIVRKAAERMGGTVGATSVLGQGSKFWLQLKKGDVL